MPRKSSDLRIQVHGSLVSVKPISEAARRWIEENVESEGWQWLGARLCVDAHFADDIARGAEADGLSVNLVF